MFGLGKQSCPKADDFVFAFGYDSLNHCGIVSIGEIPTVQPVTGGLLSPFMDGKYQFDSRMYAPHSR